MKIWFVFLVILYLPPLARIACQSLRVAILVPRILLQILSRNRVGRRVEATLPRATAEWICLTRDGINRVIGICEYSIRPLRNYSQSPLLVLCFIVSLSRGLLSGNWATVSFPFFVSLFFLLVTSYSVQQEHKTSLQAAEFLRTNPSLHPQYFFDAIFKLLGPFSYSLPPSSSLPSVSPEAVSFKQHKRSRQSYWVLLPIVWDTARLAHICLKCLKYIGPEYTREIFDLMGAMWGKRVLQWIRGELTVTGAEKLQNLEGKILLVLNHKSQLDFILTFFALSHVRLPSGRGLRPRFITAKDHFVDNVFVYEMLGVGKLIEAVDMVFIERKKSQKGIADLSKAAETFADKEIEIAIFPQGTRALGDSDRSGKRRDAGYYTTVPPKDAASDLGHLRKGTAYLTIDTLLELKKRRRGETGDSKLNLVFIAVQGTATALARHSLKLQTETEIAYKIGETLVVDPSITEGAVKPSSGEAASDEEKRYRELVNSLHGEIDLRLTQTLKIHENLHHRFLVDLQGHFRFSPDRMKAIEVSIAHLAEGSSVFYQILDRLYTLPPDRWNPHLSELAQLLLDGSSVDRFKVLRQDITLAMLQSTKTKLHGKRV